MFRLWYDFVFASIRSRPGVLISSIKTSMPPQFPAGERRMRHALIAGAAVYTTTV
jgi:hypothetical protein